MGLYGNVPCPNVHSHISPHKRGLEQICLPFDLTTAISPAVTPAHRTEDKIVCAFRPASPNKKEVKKFSTNMT